MRLTPAGLLAQGRLIPVGIGRGGIVHGPRKAEGDGATPATTLRIVATLYRPDRLAAPAPWARPIGPGDLWCDDPAHSNYNHLVRAPFPASHEALRRADPLYDIVLVTDWNWPRAKAGRGSAIFLHRWRGAGRPTAGCIAMAARDLAWLAARVRPGARIIVPELASAVRRRGAAALQV